MTLRKLLNRIGWTRADLKIHVHALCWNEERMLPYFFRHYDEIASRYFIYDTGSTDRSIEILRANHKVTLENLELKGDSFVDAARNHNNECWKRSRDEADWVIICDIDEHIYHEDLKEYLKRCQEKGITLLPSEGYEMVSDEFPPENQALHKTVRSGMRSRFCDKYMVLNPNKVREMKFEVGRHSAAPVGKIVTPEENELKLLHYKYLGLPYLTVRYAELKRGLRAMDIEMGWGFQYLWDREKITAEFEKVKEEATLVI